MRVTGAARLLVCLSGSALLATTGCGGGPAQPPGSTKIVLADFKFEPSTLSVASGKEVFFLVNNGSSGHDMVITSDRGGARVVARSPMVPAGETAVLTISDLAPGAYFIRCDVPGHAESGMVGSLTVT